MRADWRRKIRVFPWLVDGHEFMVIHRGIFSWFKSLICVLKAIQRVWMSWGTDSSHWMVNCHKSCKMSFAITMTGPRRSDNLAISESMTRFDTTWASVSSLKRNWNVFWHWFHCMQNITWIRSIISDNDDHDCLFLIIQCNSRPMCLSRMLLILIAEWFHCELVLIRRLPR